MQIVWRLSAESCIFDVKARELGLLSPTYLDSGDFSDNYRLKPQLLIKKTKKMDIRPTGHFKCVPNSFRSKTF